MAKKAAKATTTKSKKAAPKKAVKKLVKPVGKAATKKAKSVSKPAVKAAIKKAVKPKTAPKVPAKTKAKVVKKSVKAAGKAAPKAPAKAPKDKVQLLADAVVEGILEKKGRNISVMNLKSIHNRVCDFYIICQADSNTQVNAVAGSVEETVKKLIGDRPYRSEGFQNSEWVLIDYVTVVVHIFQSHIREFYNLEALWADAEVEEIAFD